ncbi:MAG TPA: aspartate aminotransferase family protein [Firmicutes bacterium]|nr:aspartate aminotransferase family protein [Bacillota bacterium]
MEAQPTLKPQLTNDELVQLDREYYLPVFKRVPLALVRGAGSHVWDADGNEYLDALGGIAVNALGHCPPEVVQALGDQAGRLMHVSNFYVSPPQAMLARRLAVLSGLERVFVTNSGGESVEAAVKIARKYAHQNGRGGEIISFEGCFHGRTLATIAAGDAKYQRGFEPLPAGFRQIPFNDVKALRQAVSKDTAAILVEPIQGEGGIRPTSADLLSEARRLCDDLGMALVFDEVQCGIARTGKWFACAHYGVRPDIMALAKGLGAGFPVGATLCSEKIAGAIAFGDHGTTFGGNPLACRCALATLDAIEDNNLVDYVAKQGARLIERLQTAGEKQPQIAEVRGRGLMLGVELDFPGAAVVEEMKNRGVLGNCTRDKVLRLVPPLNTPAAELDRMADVLLDSVREVAGRGRD